ncbi:MAG TPA: phosphoserine transaminase [Acidimicrobiales bacterium]|nr:phosphoserine transaminase [Acidimicrobiales bacterium]
MTTGALPHIEIPPDLLPGDGRFGSGPSKVPQAALDALAAAGPSYMGTSHRRDGVKSVVGRVRRGLTDLFSLPDGYEVVLGNGGSTAFWDIAGFCLIEQHSQHLSFGEFSSKFAAAVGATPHLGEPEVIRSEPGTAPRPAPHEGIDTYALTHNETSTGVAMPLGFDRSAADAGSLVLVDATSAAGGVAFDPTDVDAYYFAPQKCFAGDGGLWLAAMSPAAVERSLRLAGSRWVPPTLDLSIAIENSRLDQTYNTPALATLFLLATQVEWSNDNGGMAFAAGRSAQSAATLYGWADASSFASPFVADQAARSPVVGTIDLDDSLPVDTVCGVLRANGIVDTEGYRKLGRNQLRIAMFPAIDPADIEALTACLDHIAERL